MRRLFVLTIVISLCVNLVSALAMEVELCGSFAVLKPPNSNVILLLSQIQTVRTGAEEIDKSVSDANNSGLTGITKAITISGVPGGQNTERAVSMEFAIARVENGKPAYHKAVFVRSDQSGQYKIALMPGTYWIGPKAKALDPEGYVPTDVSFSERIVVVREGVFTQIQLSEVRYAP